MIRPGFKFETRTDARPYILARTASHYGYGTDLEIAPKAGTVYIICKDGSVQSVSDPNRPIGWEIFEENDQFYYRVTQVGFGPESVHVTCVGLETSEIPTGRGFIGTSVSACASREAMILEFDDDEPEVTSPLCPGAPIKDRAKKCNTY